MWMINKLFVVMNISTTHKRNKHKKEKKKKRNGFVLHEYSYKWESRERHKSDSFFFFNQKGLWLTQVNYRWRWCTSRSPGRSQPKKEKKKGNKFRMSALKKWVKSDQVSNEQSSTYDLFNLEISVGPHYLVCLSCSGGDAANSCPTGELQISQSIGAWLHAPQS